MGWAALAAAVIAFLVGLGVGAHAENKLHVRRCEGIGVTDFGGRNFNCSRHAREGQTDV